MKAGLVRIRYMRPFPARQIVEALAGAAAVGVHPQLRDLPLLLHRAAEPV